MHKFYEYFGFTKTERRGLLVLSVLSILIILFPYLIPYLYKPQKINHSITFLQDAKDILEAVEEEPVFSKTVSSKKWNSNPKVEPVYFTFNPNNLSRHDWRKLGLSDKQIDVIYKYESKGGKFRSKEDVKKMYVIDEKMYQALSPFIVIPKDEPLTVQNKSTNRNHEWEDKKELKFEAFDINLADTNQLKQIPGIGSVLSNRIIKFRDILGGFHHIDQLKEVYGLPSETLETLQKYIVLNSDHIKKINLNKVSLEELQRHPYISRKHAQMLINYRIQHGPYSSFESLAGLQGIEPEILRKIEPYLKY